MYIWCKNVNFLILKKKKSDILLSGVAMNRENKIILEYLESVEPPDQE